MVITSREVFANLAKLFFDDMEVIDQPLSRRRDRTAVSNCFHQRAVSSYEFATVILEAWEQLSSALLRNRYMFRGEGLCILLQALDAEYLAAKRLLVGVTRRVTKPAQ